MNKDKKNNISIFKLYSFKHFSFNDMNKAPLSFLYANSFSFYKYISIYQLLINFFNYKQLLKKLNFNKI